MGGPTLAARKSSKRPKTEGTKRKAADGETRKSSRRAKKPAASANPRRVEARRRMYHDLVFEAAEALFADRGFENATMQDIAGEAGVSLQTLYSVFPGKVDLYEEIRTTRSEEFREALAAALAEPLDHAFDVFSTSVHAFVDYLCAHRAFLRLQIQEARAWALLASDSPESAVLREIAAILRRGIDRGEFRDDDPEKMALVGIAILQVFLPRMVDLADEDEARRTLADEIVEQLRRAWCVAPEGGDSTDPGESSDTSDTPDGAEATA